MTEISIRHARIADCPALARIIIEATKFAFRDRVPDRCWQWVSPAESAANWASNFVTEETLASGNYLFVAEEKDGGVIGLAMLTPTAELDKLEPEKARRYPQELRSLQVDPVWQRRGIGRRLVRHVADQVQAAGENRLLVRVVAENPNHGFYQRLAGRPLGTQPYVWAGYKTTVTVYGWDDLSKLSKSTG